MSDATESTSRAKRTFISYASEDRARVGGLAPLLEALGHEIFFDQRSLIAGQRWHERIDEALETADALVVFWTKHAARSKWVRYEYERFVVRHPDGVLTAMLGDETPLTPLLAERQSTDFAPLVNELLAMQRRLRADGMKPDAIRGALLARLAEAGIALDDNRQRKLLRLFAPAGLAGLLAAPGMALLDLSNTGVHAIASLSGAQAVVVATAAVSGGLVCGALHPAADESLALTGGAPHGMARPATGQPAEAAIEKPGGSLIPPAAPVQPAPPNPPTLSRVETAPPPATVDCAKISCDCPGIDAGILTGPWRQECRNQEAALRKSCEQQNRFPTAPCSMSGPNTVPGTAPPA